MDQTETPAADSRIYSDPEIEIVLHLGVHCTDDEKLIWSMRQDKKILDELRIAVPRRRFFTSILREFTTERLKGAPAGLAEQEEVFRRMIDTAQVDRLVLSYDSFLAAPDRVLTEGTIYPRAGQKALELRNIFPANDMEFLFAVRNPVTFLADLFRVVDGPRSFEGFVDQVDLAAFRWSDVIGRIRQAVPDVPVVVWANEDTPFVWAEVLRHAAGLDAGHEMSGRFDVARSIMTDEGCAAFDAYIAGKPPADPHQEARVVEIFLDRFARPGEVQETLLPPGFSSDAIDTLTDLYEEDLERIAAMPGVTFVST